ncbi:hypothetical protein LOC67_19930 [Stieleria sp. JC731]|uniref:hypothetical protein n=1 Tax=Pirellulaceae TaxID=2691357 RepID=UPI001E288BE1|nr:hypothetical protein [Stieleria sp. JC731]MCC9602827.1 hypothetical protein [Stieleria sp. JC731]
MSESRQPLGLFDDLPNAKWIVFKAVLFVVLGGLSGVLLITRLSEWRDVLILATCIWSCCRAYYFAFYVIEHWIDSDFKYSGLGSMLVYIWRQRRQR